MTDESTPAGADDRTTEATTERVAHQPQQCRETVADKPDSHPSAGRKLLFRY
jgi:hypothetical protein